MHEVGSYCSDHLASSIETATANLEECAHDFLGPLLNFLKNLY